MATTTTDISTGGAGGDAAAVRAAATRAQDGVAAAIEAIVGLGAAAPVALREAVHHLGCAFVALGYADGQVGYSVPREADDVPGGTG